MWPEGNVCARGRCSLHTWLSEWLLAPWEVLQTCNVILAQRSHSVAFSALCTISLSLTSRANSFARTGGSRRQGCTERHQVGRETPPIDDHEARKALLVPGDKKMVIVAADI
ncbi:hypothetical protein EJ03DRAFT_112640 [Teratosphaeria nubilosa]|uniref:Uncharacterized protein n=1 Tax=Teratosphaeria nubilosa TaxID=161662 RepID=A0A6G1L8E7_9PEZI|nr:hypothetical protein EJ03DRAFT_112640 [Teratosphaeria nubilosa]